MKLGLWDASVFPLGSVGFGLNPKNYEFHQLFYYTGNI